MKPAQAREMLSAFSASGLSAAAFCRLHGLQKQRVGYWLQRLDEIDAVSKGISPKPEAEASGFALVREKPSDSRDMSMSLREPMQTLEATLPGGSRVVVHGHWDSASVQTWLTAITGGSC